MTSACELRTPPPATGVSRARGVLGVSTRVSPKTGVLGECLTECLRGPSGCGLWSVQKVSRECPAHLFDTPGICSGHFLERGPKGPGDTLLDTLSGHSGVTFGLKARETPVAGGVLCNMRDHLILLSL